MNATTTREQARNSPHCVTHQPCEREIPTRNVKRFSLFQNQIVVVTSFVIRVLVSKSKFESRLTLVTIMFILKTTILPLICNLKSNIAGITLTVVTDFG